MEWRGSRTGARRRQRHFDQMLFTVAHAKTWGRHSLVGTFRYDTTMSGDAPLNRLFTMGGFLDLSGLSNNELAGPYATRLGASYYRRIGDLALFPAFAGVSVELGNVWAKRSEISAKSAILGGSLWAAFKRRSARYTSPMATPKAARARSTCISGEYFDRHRELTMATSRKTSTKARSVDLEALDLAHMFHPNTNLAAFHKSTPLVLVRGEGVHVWDNHGKRYIEGMAGLWCTTLGYGDEELASTAYDQMKKLSFTHLVHGQESRARRAARGEACGWRRSTRRACSSATRAPTRTTRRSSSRGTINNARGTAAEEKDHRAAEGLSRHDVRDGGPHGLAGVPQELRRAAGGDFAHGRALLLPRRASPANRRRTTRRGSRAISRRLIVREDPDTIAAFFAEPLMGVGGVLLPPRTYFEKIQAVLAQHDILLIDDEVITGFGRTGELWGAQAFGMKPSTRDGGEGAVVGVPADQRRDRAGVSLRADDCRRAGRWASSATASRTRGIRSARRSRCGRCKSTRSASSTSTCARSARSSRSSLAALASHPLVGDTRGIGLVGACELVQNKKTKAAFDAKRAVGAKCMAALPGAGADRARDRRRDRDVSAVHRDPRSRSTRSSPACSAGSTTRSSGRARS